MSSVYKKDRKPTSYTLAILTQSAAVTFNDIIYNSNKNLMKIINSHSTKQRENLERIINETMECCEIYYAIKGRLTSRFENIIAFKILDDALCDILIHMHVFIGMLNVYYISLGLYKEGKTKHETKLSNKMLKLGAIINEAITRATNISRMTRQKLRYEKKKLMKSKKFTEFQLNNLLKNSFLIDQSLEREKLIKEYKWLIDNNYQNLLNFSD